LADTYLKGAIFIFTAIASLLTTYLLSRYRELAHPESKGKTDPLKSSDLFRKPYKEIKELLDHGNSGLWLSSFLLNGAIGVLVAYYPDYKSGYYNKKSAWNLNFQSLCLCNDYLSARRSS
jgi:hypothetical protein